MPTLAKLVVVSIAFAALVGCTLVDSGLAVDAKPAPSGGGYCCPIDPDFSGCLHGAPVDAGGWVASPSECATHQLGGYDGPQYVRGQDLHGCAQLVWDTTVPMCGAAPDAGR